MITKYVLVKVLSFSELCEYAFKTFGIKPSLSLHKSKYFLIFDGSGLTDFRLSAIGNSFFSLPDIAKFPNLYFKYFVNKLTIIYKFNK